jgi:hypothetical protein
LICAEEEGNKSNDFSKRISGGTGRGCYFFLIHSAIALKNRSNDIKSALQRNDLNGGNGSAVSSLVIPAQPELI